MRRGQEQAAQRAALCLMEGSGLQFPTQALRSHSAVQPAGSERKYGPLVNGPPVGR